MRYVQGLTATTVALTLVLILVVGILLLPRPIIWLINQVGEVASPGVEATSELSNEARQQQIDALWDFYREAQAVVQASDRERDVVNNVLQAVVGGAQPSPGLYLLLKEAERNQNRAATRIRDRSVPREVRSARSELYRGLRYRADAAARLADYLARQNLEALWASKLEQEQGDAAIAQALDMMRAYGQTIGINLATGEVSR